MPIDEVMEKYYWDSIKPTESERGFCGFDCEGPSE